MWSGYSGGCLNRIWGFLGPGAKARSFFIEYLQREGEFSKALVEHLNNVLSGVKLGQEYA